MPALPPDTVAAPPPDAVAAPAAEPKVTARKPRLPSFATGFTSSTALASESESPPPALVAAVGVAAGLTALGLAGCEVGVEAEVVRWSPPGAPALAPLPPLEAEPVLGADHPPTLLPDMDTVTPREGADVAVPAVEAATGVPGAELEGLVAARVRAFDGDGSPSPRDTVSLPAHMEGSQDMWREGGQSGQHVAACTHKQWWRQILHVATSSGKLH